MKNIYSKVKVTVRGWNNSMLNIHYLTLWEYYISFQPMARVNMSARVMQSGQHHARSMSEQALGTEHEEEA